MAVIPQLWLVRSVLVLAAFLLFAVQPLVGRLLLPLVGGAPAGWMVVLCFFQLALLLGYLLALGLARLTARAQLGVALLGLVLSGLVLDLDLTTQSKSWSATQVLLLLSLSLGPVALMLGCLSPLLQRVASLMPDQKNPYRLYAASNAGSLLGLLSYPLLVEPLFALSQQKSLWLAGYILLGLMLALLTYQVRIKSIAPPPERVQISARQFLPWLGLAFLPAALSVALAGLLSTEFGAVPVIWIIPLLLYLLSFIIAFGWPQANWTKATAILAGTFLLLAVATLVFSGNRAPLAFAVLCLSFFVAALAAQRRLVDLQPRAAAMPHYYVAIAFGGALGGLFSTLLAPQLFQFPVEYGVLLAALCLSVNKDKPSAKIQRLVGRVILVLSLGALLVMQFNPAARTYRNFYGVSLVIDRLEPDGQVQRYLVSGGGMQGRESVKPSQPAEAGFYFSALQPIFAQEQIKRIGVIGGGVGISVCFTAPGRSFIFYEIDPKHREIAERDFSYFKLCGAPTWRMGDGRLELQADTQARYDILMVDAFQGGLIPVHLITREALALYQQRLAPGGVLLYNLNSIYYDFYPQLAAQAKATGWQMWRAPSTWALLAPSDSALDYLRFQGWQPYVLEHAPQVWTDDHANLLGALQ
jgi:hypothetical protein